MSMAKNIRELFKRLRVRPDASVDRKVHDGITRALHEWEKSTSAATQPSLWRIIMKSRITKIATAAIIVIGVLIAINHLGGSIDGVSVALGDVQQAFVEQSWVHLKYDNGRERWYDLQNGRYYYKSEKGRISWITFVDRVRNIRQSYHPTLGQHISEDRPAIYPEGVIPPWEPKSAWEEIVGHLEKAAEEGGSERWRVERAVDDVDGIVLVRFNCYYNDALGRWLVKTKIWADPETQLPVKIWERLGLARRKEQGREFITGYFDFPVDGPGSIYDLGVPEGLPIVKQYDRIPEPSIVEITEAGKAALERFPLRYRAVRWANDEGSEIELVWRNGKMIHHNHYFNLDDHPDYHLELPAKVEEVLDWANTQTPVSIAIYDGERSYIKSGPLPEHFINRDEPYVRVSRGESLFGSSKPHEDFWPYANRKPERFNLIDEPLEELSGYIGLRIDSGDIRRDFYIDPEHDYICVRWIWWIERSGSWQKKREYECSDFTSFEQGQWYATRRILITYPDPEKGTSRGGANWNIDIKELKEHEYPPNTFDSEKLMEGVKVETY
jgi:hypothetical protein